MKDKQILWTIAPLLVAVLFLAWYLLQTPLHGTIAATQTVNGVADAVVIDVKNLVVEQSVLHHAPTEALLAAVPSPVGTKVAVLARTRDGQRHVSITDAQGISAVHVRDGLADVPSWSTDGTSIAFSEFKGHASSSVSGDPDQWTVVRAVQNGDSLVVGQGYHPFPSPNQHTFALTSRGIVLLSYNDSGPNVVVASPVPVPVSTPFTVSHDGMRVAWVAPADKSLQVYSNVNGYFVPLLVSNKISPQSLVFAPSGDYLIGATYSEATTTLSLITISGGAIKHVGDFPGFIKLHTWDYEK